MISHLFRVLDNTILVLHKCEKGLAKFIILLETSAQDFNQMEKKKREREIGYCKFIYELCAPKVTADEGRHKIMRLPCLSA